MAEKKERKLYRIGPGRLSYCNPLGRQNDKGEMRYGSSILLTPEAFSSCKDVAPLIAEINRIGREDISVDYSLKTARNKCVQKTDEMEGDKLPETLGLITFKASSQDIITCYHPDGTKMENINDIKAIKSGYWGYLIVNPYSYNNSGNKGVTLGVSAIQFWKKDTEFSMREKAIASCIEQLEVPVTEISLNEAVNGLMSNPQDAI